MTPRVNQVKIDFELWDKQLTAFDSHAQETAYGGAAAGGKSHLERVQSIVLCLDIPGFQYYLFRREFSDVYTAYVEGPTGYLALIEPLQKVGAAALVGKEIRFFNGSKIYLCHCQHEKDVLSYKSFEFHFLNIAQAEEFTPFMIRYLRTRVRCPEEFKRTFPEKYKIPQEWWRDPEKTEYKLPGCLYTWNPGGPGHIYLKEAFYDGHEKGDGSLWRAPKDDGEMLRTFISARIEDNLSVDKSQYASQLGATGSEAHTKALLYGDMTVTLGQFFKTFAYDRNVCPYFVPPEHWFKFRVIDWGFASPFAVGWFCYADGEPFEVNEPSLWPKEYQKLIKDGDGEYKMFVNVPRGTRIMYREWYGCDPKDITKGLELTNEEMCEGITLRSRREGHMVTLADSKPFQDQGGWTIARQFAENGIPLTRADDSRIPGWSTLSSLFKGDDRGPQFLIMESCSYAIKIIPMAQHDDIDFEDLVCSADHIHDMLRYAAMAHKVINDRADVSHYQVEEQIARKPTMKQILESRGQSWLGN